MWDDVKEAVSAELLAYTDLLTLRGDSRAHVKQVRAAEEAWLDAHGARHRALITHWTPEDGTYDNGEPGGAKSAGRVLQRYYAETGVKKKEGKSG